MQQWLAGLLPVELFSMTLGHKTTAAVQTWESNKPSGATLLKLQDNKVAMKTKKKNQNKNKQSTNSKSEFMHSWWHFFLPDNESALNSAKPINLLQSTVASVCCDGLLAAECRAC